MSEIQRFVIEDNGRLQEIYVETPEVGKLPDQIPVERRPGEKGIARDAIIQMQNVQEKVQAYANLAIGALKNMPDAEEVTLKFGVKLNGKTGIIFTESSAEGSLEVQVKYNFQNKSREALQTSPLT
jgi:hypothetical protein